VTTGSQTTGVREVTVASPAKINLSLGVGPVRADGFHPLATVYQAVGLYDDVTVRPAESWRLTVSGEGVDVSGVPDDESNLALRAAALLARHHGLDGAVEMVIRKRIPVAGGMAGGSTDAAAALVACDALWATRTPQATLMGLAAELGSDVPFCLVGGTALGSGRGERVTPAMSRGSYWWVVAVDDEGLATPEVYREFDRHEGPSAPEPEIPDALMSALRGGDAGALGRALDNDLQPAVFRLRPELRELVTTGLAGSARGALVSGSGPTCLFLADDEEHANAVAACVEEQASTVLVARGPAPGARVIR
jgi:4-diphosphocytidyl-2-C-methyl-D-erythritol kinase